MHECLIDFEAPRRGITTGHGYIRPKLRQCYRDPTELSLIPPALALAGWAMEHITDIEAGRTAYEAQHSPASSDR
ncbi:hypothetical protein ACIBO2_52505 [Nonomuraea sp. NPDC050022]|uniref:hypothetical protein n=1 Tax=unclassified Nonomuraea TaxID=2593643 RepID=UPI0033D7E837